MRTRRPIQSNLSRSAVGKWLCGATLLPVVVLLVLAQDPRIEFIDRLGTNMVTIHFDTEANRTYELQFQNPAGTANAPWTNLFVAPRIPFPNHYIVVDTRTNRARIYRLKVTP